MKRVFLLFNLQPFIRAANVMSNHAVGVKRYDALKRIDEEGFTAHGDMF